MKAKKTISLVLCAVLLVAASVAGTVAYFTDQDAVVNTFAVGNVAIELYETNLTAGPSDDANTYEGNSYHLLPSQTYVKDPTVTVLDGSEDCYVRMMVTVSNMENLKMAMPSTDPDFTSFYSDEGLFLLQKLAVDENGNSTWNQDWQCVGYNAGTYEFRYKEVVSGKSGNKELPALFETITVPGAVDEIQMPYLDNLTITVEAHAIQATGFADADAAWIAFGVQNP